MQSKFILSAIFGGALLLAPGAARAQEGEMHEAKAAQSMGHAGMEGMHHGATKADALSGTAKAKGKAKAKAKSVKKAKSAKSEAKMEKHRHWVCPMHDGGEGDKPGRCPKCGMDMVEEPAGDAAAPKAAADGDTAPNAKMKGKDALKHEGHEHHHD